MSGALRDARRGKPSDEGARVPSPAARKDARIIELTPDDASSVALVIKVLPDPDDLRARTLVLLPAEASGGRRSLVRAVLGALGRTRSVSRAVRCSALVARGYVDVAAGIDPETRADLAWGYAPNREE